MNRIDSYLRIVSDPAAPALDGKHPTDSLLLSLVVHIAFSDGVVDMGEFELLERMLPGLETGEILAAVLDLTQQPLDVATLSSAFPSAADRQKLLQLAEALALLDEFLHPGEAELLESLRTEF